MGVDANLHLSAALLPEAIVYAVAKAHGVDVPLVQGEQNVFVARDFIVSTDGFSFGVLEDTTGCDRKVPQHERRGDFMCYMHSRNSYDNPLGAGWTLSGRANARVIALLRTVAEKLGGLLLYSDYDDRGVLIHGELQNEEVGLNFTNICETIYSIEKAVVTGEDIENATYDWKCDECDAPMDYDRKCRNDHSNV